MTRARSSAVTMAALLLGASLQPMTARAQSASTPPYPAPGQLVDIGGWRLHINCTGEVSPSQPTVILEAGLGDFSVEWSLVQPPVSRFARVCSYDRAGDGWSDLGPHPRTMHQIVFELHALLTKGAVPPPYILVGHSYGGALVRLYAATHPTDVAGMVLIDSGHLNAVSNINGQLVRLADKATGKTIPPVQMSGPLRESDIPAAARAQIEAGARQAAPTANEPPRDKLPADAQRMRTWALSQVKHYAAAVNPFEGEELASMIADDKKTDHPLGDRPLIVLSRGTPAHKGEDQWIEDERVKGQAALVGLSTKGRQIIAAGSGHHIQIQDPELVTRSIADVVTAARR